MNGNFCDCSAVLLTFIAIIISLYWSYRAIYPKPKIDFKILLTTPLLLDPSILVIIANVSITAITIQHISINFLFSNDKDKEFLYLNNGEQKNLKYGELFTYDISIKNFFSHINNLTSKKSNCFFKCFIYRWPVIKAEDSLGNKYKAKISKSLYKMYKKVIIA